jgi:sulfite exporter TauE/SafE
MNDAPTITTYVALLMAALAGSLHCVGMCGPILLAFSGAMQPAPSINDAAATSSRPALSFLWYHAGRIWTYGMLGLLAGYVGCCVRHSSSLVTWQRAVGVTSGVVVIIVGLVLMGVVPGLRVDQGGACGFKRIWKTPLLRSLLRTQAVGARLLLGAMMGLLPCGLVYAMLAVCATLPSPMHAALGMVIFGIGTIPSLTAVLISSHLVPLTWRRYSTRITALMVIGTGLWMAVRSTMELCGRHV